jgi:hypothetical protein
MRLAKLLVGVAVAVGAFALAGANARVATASDGAPPPTPQCTGSNVFTAGTNPNTDFCVHAAGLEPTTVFDASLCGDANSDQLLEQCGHVTFNTTATGTVSGQITFNTGPQGLNDVHLALCVPMAGTLDCSLTQTNCTETTTNPLPNPNENVTVTLTCTNVPAGTYELIVQPTFYSSCGLFPTTECLLNPPGANISGNITFTNTSGSITGTPTPPPDQDKVTGGGQTGKGTNFAVEGFENDLTKGKVKVLVRSVCSFRSDKYYSVIVYPKDPQGDGHATITGHGIATDSTGDHPEDFRMDADDNEKSGIADTFQFSSQHCNNGTGVVTSGNVKTHFKS